MAGFRPNNPNWFQRNPLGTALMALACTAVLVGASAWCWTHWGVDAGDRAGPRGGQPAAFPAPASGR